MKRLSFENLFSLSYYEIIKSKSSVKMTPKTVMLLPTPPINQFNHLAHYLQYEYDRDGFHWNSKTQNEVLGAFFSLHWATQLPGGILAARYGTKLIFGLANFIGCITCMLVPITAYLSFQGLFWLRLLQGFVAGAAWPGEN